MNATESNRLLQRRARDVLSRAESFAPEVAASSRADIDRLVELARQVLAPVGSESGGGLSQPERQELGRLVELTARRDARAMPYAALGRAALAQLSGASQDALGLLTEFELKVSLFGH